MQADDNSHIGIDRWWAWVIFALSFGYFWSLRPDGLSTYGLSTELVRLGLIGGNWWADSLNLLLRLVGLVGLLPGYWSFEAGQLLAVFLGSASLAMLYRLLNVASYHLTLPNDWLGFYGRNLVIVGLLGSQTFSLQSIYLERYMLVVAMGLGLLLLLIQQTKGRLATWRHILMGVGLILAASYHWLFWWGAFGIGLLWVISSPARLVWQKLGYLIGGAIGLMAGVVLVALLVGNDRPPIHSFFSSSATDIASYYRTLFVQDGFEGNLGIDRAKINMIILSEKTFFTHPMGGLLLALFVVGLLRVLRTKTAWGTWMLWMSVGLFGIGLLFFSGLTEPMLGLELYRLVWRVWLAAGAGVGLIFLLDRIRLGLTLLHSTQVVRLLFSLGTAAVLCTTLYFGYYQHTQTFQENVILTHDMTQLPQNSLVLCFDTVTCSDLLYLHQIAQVRSDLLLVPYYYRPRSYNLDLPEYRPFGYADYPYVMHEILAVALHDDSQRVFSFGITNDYYRFLGLELGFVHYLPYGNYGELTLVTPPEWPSPSYLKLDVDRVPDNGGLQSGFVATLLRNRILNSLTYFKSGYYLWGYEEMNAAAPIAHKLSSSDFATFLSDRNSAEQQVKSALFTSSGEVDSLDLIKSEIPRYVEAGYPGRAVDLARGLLLLSPYDVSIRETVAALYERVGLYDLARFEQANVEKLKRETKQ